MFTKFSYVSHCPGHRNSQGDLAEWCVKSHKDDHIISSHGTEAEAKKHLQDMHAHSGAKQARFLTIAEAKQAFYDKVAAAGGHYLWEANGDEAIIISPDHKIKHLPFEEAKPFWAKLFELEEQIENPDQLQLAIDDFCASYFPEQQSQEVEPVKMPFRSSLLKKGSDLHNRVEKASAELAKMWDKVKPAMTKGYAIEHHLHLAQQTLQQGLDLISTQPEVAAVYISQAEDTLRKATQEIAHLEI